TNSAMSTAKLPLGGANPHVKASRGGDANLMKFYCTTSASTHGSHFANFQPRPGRHTGTGYQANIRPTVQYSGRLDQVDNPAIGRIVAGNYRTVFQRDFNPYSTPTGSEPLPLTAHKVPTGFVRDAMLMPMQRRRQGPPQPLTRAATVAGPSEYRDKYSGRQLAPVDLARSDVGPKERSGFTNNVKLNEPVRHTEHSPHRNEKPGWMTHRPTGVSIYTTGYRSLEVPDGREPLPHLADRGLATPASQLAPSCCRRLPTGIWLMPTANSATCPRPGCARFRSPIRPSSSTCSSPTTIRQYTRTCTKASSTQTRPTQTELVRQPLATRNQLVT
ncbi:hypothetical protein BOX15_Mlig019693g1, partial [Macrostomum lignano]